MYFVGSDGTMTLYSDDYSLDNQSKIIEGVIDSPVSINDHATYYFRFKIDY